MKGVMHWVPRAGYKVNVSRTLMSFMMLLLVSGHLRAEETQSIWDRETLTGGFWGLNEALEPSGVEFSFYLNNTICT